jgi:hypothetical protein
MTSALSVPFAPSELAFREAPKASNPKGFEGAKNVKSNCSSISLRLRVSALKARLIQTIPHFRRSHHSEKRSSSNTRKTSGKSHSSLVSRMVTPASE